MEEIKNYLEQEGKSYQDGISLLSRYCKNRMLVNTLSKKESGSHRAKLEHELKKILATAPEPKYEEVATTAPNVDQNGKPSCGGPEAGCKGCANCGKVPDAPAEPVQRAVAPGTSAEFDGLIEERRRLYSERCKLSNTLADAANDEERLEIVTKIEAVEESRKAMLARIIHFEKYGAFPKEASAAAPQPAAHLDKADLIKTRNNLRSQLSKAKNAVEAKPNDIAKQEKLAKIEVELNAVDLQLKRITEGE